MHRNHHAASGGGLKVEGVKAQVGNEKLANRSLKIINENNQYKYEPDQNEDLNKQIKRFQKQNRHKMLCKQAEGLEKIQEIVAAKEKLRYFKQVLDFTIELADKEYTLESKQAHRNGFLNRVTRTILFKRWIEAF